MWGSDPINEVFTTSVRRPDLPSGDTDIWRSVVTAIANHPLTVGSAAHVVRRGCGTPIVMIHGNGADHRMVLELDDVFAYTGEWERIYIDLPGFGNTAPLNNAGGLPEIADWLDQQIEDLIGLQSFALLGYSMGGLLAREIATRRPEQVCGLALIAPVVDPDHDNRRVPEHTVLQPDQTLLESLHRYEALWYRTVSVIQSRENWERNERAAFPGQLIVNSIANQRLANRYWLPQSPDRQLTTHHYPKLILTGKQDHVVGFEDQFALASQLPNTTYAALDHAGHHVHLDQPDLVRAHLAHWAAQAREFVA